MPVLVLIILRPHITARYCAVTCNSKFLSETYSRALCLSTKPPGAKIGVGAQIEKEATKPKKNTKKKTKNRAK